MRATGEPGELRVPYLYIVGDQVPVAAVPIAPYSSRGYWGEVSQRRVAVRFVDRFGAGVSDAPVEFRVAGGQIKVVSAAERTDSFGIIESAVEFGPSAGPHTIVAVAGGVELPLEFRSERDRPRVDGIYNSANMSADRPLAPGSLATILGAGFGTFSGEAPPSPLPVALKSVSVSFDFPEAGISVPGRVFYVDPETVGVQVPWELAGLNFALVKVRVTDPYGDESLSEPLVLELADVSPGLYWMPDGLGWTSAWHAEGGAVTTTDPASAGDRILLQLTGTGPFAEILASGLAFEESVEMAGEVLVTIDGRSADVISQGSYPGVAGLAFVEAEVPAGVSAGQVEVIVSINGIPSDIGVLPVR